MRALEEVIRMEDNRIVELFWERNENAIKETELKYGRRLHGLQIMMKMVAQDQRKVHQSLQDLQLQHLSWES